MPWIGGTHHDYSAVDYWRRCLLLDDGIDETQPASTLGNRCERLANYDTGCTFEFE